MGKLPVICERKEGSMVSDLQSKKFLIPRTMTVGNFTKLLHQRIAKEVGGTLYLLIGSEVLEASETAMNDLYHSHKDDDGFLYVFYTNELPSTTKPMYPFKSSHTLEQRVQEAGTAKALQKVPIICERVAQSSLPAIANKKFLVSPSMTVGMLTTLLRDMISSQPSEPFYLFVGRALLSSSATTIQDLYSVARDADGLLYILYDNTVPPSARQMGAYKVSHPLAERRSDAAAAVAAGKIPIICEKEESAAIAGMAKKRFTVPLTMTVGTFTALLQDCISAEAPQTIYLFVRQSVLTASSLPMSDLYNTYKDDDGLLYVTYSTEAPPTTPQIGFYKGTYTKRERMSEAEKAWFLEKVPIICERAERSGIPMLEQRKFFVSYDMTVRTLITLLRDRITAELKCPIYLFIQGNPITHFDESIANLYAKYKDDDKFLYITYSSSVFITR